MSSLGVAPRDAARLEVPALELVERADARRVRAHDVVLADVEVGHAVGVGVRREQQVVVGLARVGALGALLDLDEPGVDRARRVGDRALGEQRRAACARPRCNWCVRKSCTWSPEPRNVVRSSFSAPGADEHRRRCATGCSARPMPMTAWRRRASRPRRPRRARDVPRAGVEALVGDQLQVRRRRPASYSLTGTTRASAPAVEVLDDRRAGAASELDAACAGRTRSRPPTWQHDDRGVEANPGRRRAA